VITLFFILPHVCSIFGFVCSELYQIALVPALCESVRNNLTSFKRSKYVLHSIKTDAYHLLAD
jgi:hypothetical protein